MTSGSGRGNLNRSSPNKSSIAITSRPSFRPRTSITNAKHVRLCSVESLEAFLPRRTRNGFLRPNNGGYSGTRPATGGVKVAERVCPGTISRSTTLILIAKEVVRVWKTQRSCVAPAIRPKEIGDDEDYVHQPATNSFRNFGTTAIPQSRGGMMDCRMATTLNNPRFTVPQVVAKAGSAVTEAHDWTGPALRGARLISGNR